MTDSILLPFALRQYVGNDARPLVGAKFYLYDANTSTPRTIYTDKNLSTPGATPTLADSNGMLPAMYTGTAAYRARLTDPDDVVIFDIQEMPGAEDTTTTPDPSVDGFVTGDIKFRVDADPQSGWVRLNGRTIGNASSAGTERKNADCEDLFTYLWNRHTWLTVSPGGRGGSASVDWAASKTISLLDYRGHSPIGLDGMGNAPSGVISAISTATGEGNVNTPGTRMGTARDIIGHANMPAHDHGGTTGTSGTHSHTYGRPNSSADVASGSAATVMVYNAFGDSSTDPAGDHTHTIPTQGGGELFPVVHPSYGVVYWMKL